MRIVALMFSAIVMTGTASSAEPITTKKAGCAPFPAYVPSPDVAYIPGIDISGNAVALPDIGNPNTVDTQLKDGVHISLDLPLSAYSEAADISQAKIVLGDLKIKDNAATLNNAPLTTQAIPTHCDQ